LLKNYTLIYEKFFLHHFFIFIFDLTYGKYETNFTIIRN